jgi:hypothetical protein
MVSTVTNPPSFYEHDIEKWKKKFENHINDRLAFKTKYYSNLDINPYVHNTNTLNKSFISTVSKLP